MTSEKDATSSSLSSVSLSLSLSLSLPLSLSSHFHHYPSIHPSIHPSIRPLPDPQQLGPLTVWVTEGGWDHGKHERKSAWRQVYKCTHAPSTRRLVPLVLDRPIRVRGGTRFSLYVHSARPGDKAIVYDDQRFYTTREDDFLKVEPGLAHLCNEPFGAWHPWGSWRRKREFVGSITYGVRFMLWNPVPEVHAKFCAGARGEPFRDLVLLLMLAKPRADCPLSWLSEDCLYYILNMCRHDWVAASAKRRSGGRGLGLSRASLSSLSTRLANAASRGSRAARALIGYATI